MALTDDQINEIRGREQAATPAPWDEEWRPIPGVRDYEVSDHGNVRSFLKAGNHRRKHADRPRLLAQHTRPNGRRTVSLPRPDGRYATRGVSRLVMLAFEGPCPDGMEVAHLNGDARDNRLTNLRYVTHQENESHKIGHGTAPVGECNGQSRLLGWQVAEIKYLADRGVSQARIADLFQIARQMVNSVLNEKTWAHIAARQDVTTLLAEVKRLQKLTAQCTCGDSHMTYEGPEPDCAVHGAVRALTEVTAERDRLATLLTSRLELRLLRARGRCGMSPETTTALHDHTAVYQAAAADWIDRYGLHVDDYWPGYPVDPADGRPCCAAGAIIASGGDDQTLQVFADYLIRLGHGARCCGCGASCDDATCIDAVETIAGWSDRQTADTVTATLRACADEVTS